MASPAKHKTAPRDPTQEDRKEIRKKNETALLPLLSTWDTVEKYLDGDSVFHTARTCSTVRDMFQEAEGFTRPALPHILGKQIQPPKTIENVGPAQRKWKQVKYSFLVLLMQPEELNGEYRKVQIHFIFESLNNEDDNDKNIGRARRVIMSRELQFRMEAYRYATTSKEPWDQWKKVRVRTNAPVTSLMKEAITKCCAEVHRDPPAFAFLDDRRKGFLMNSMDTCCKDTLVLEEFERRKERRAEEAARRRAEGTHRPRMMMR